jgi:methylmalonyl-CoA mutase
MLDDQWRRLALGALRRSGDAGADTTVADVDDLLATTTYDGLRIAALHTPGSSGPPVPELPGRTAGGWDVRQHYAEPEPGVVREAVLDDLENGATSLWLRVGADALPIDALPDALDGVHLDLAGVVLDAGEQFAPAGRAWLDLTRGRQPAAGGLGADPLGRQAGALADAVGLAVRCVAEAPSLRAITVDATVHHDAGGSDAEELGCAAAAGMAYLRALTDAGLSAPAALSQLEFRYAATADQFATIVKMRAARQLWARIAGAGGQRQHAVTSAVMMTARDPWVNLMRTTIASFAAGVGGADAVTVLPFDHRLGHPDAAARRLARNTQLLLMEEAHVGQVLDPGGGSWFIESYTADLAEAAWAWFTRIEQAGGFAAACDSGLIADKLAETWRRRAANIAHRRDPITGVSEFPNLAEQLPQRRPRPASPGHHYAEAFERLRDRSDAHPARPAVFVTNGPHVAFATNLFAAGGIAVITGPPEAFATSGTPVACVGDSGTEVEGAKRVWRDLRPGCDVVAVLTTTLDDLGVRP